MGTFVATQRQDDIEFRSVSKFYGSVEAVRDITLNVPKGAFLALLGPSGCGKTTCLRMIGGFEQPTSGEVYINGKRMNGVPAHQRPVNMVFQQYALFPHYNVFDNVAYGLRQQRPKLSADEIARRTFATLDMVRLNGFAERRIHEMSGGQQQRVALARAIVNRPSVLLLDEPLAALDKKLRTAMQIELQTLQRELGITFVLVTHDQEEALSMADIVCVMNAGQIKQIGSAQDVYDSPADLFVADFVGKTNQLAGKIEAGGDVVRLTDGSAMHIASPLPGRQGEVIIAIRPEAVRLARQSPVSGVTFQGEITHRIFLGAVAEYAVNVTGLGSFIVTSDHKNASAQGQDLIEPGETIFLNFDPAVAHIFPQGNH